MRFKLGHANLKLIEIYATYEVQIKDPKHILVISHSSSIITFELGANYLDMIMNTRFCEYKINVNIINKSCLTANFLAFNKANRI